VYRVEQLTGLGHRVLAVSAGERANDAMVGVIFQELPRKGSQEPL
jgi:hypothetical protein